MTACKLRCKSGLGEESGGPSGPSYSAREAPLARIWTTLRSLAVVEFHGGGSDQLVRPPWTVSRELTTRSRSVR